MLKLNVTKLRCGKCRKVKPETDFSRNASRTSGRAAWCKPCYNAYKQEWRSADAEVYEVYYATRSAA